jgi:hypothetical protein
VGVWPRVMKRENMGLCNGRRRERCTGSVMAKSKREKQRNIWRRERENGEKRRNVPSNGKYVFCTPDSNPDSVI